MITINSTTDNMEIITIKSNTDLGYNKGEVFVVEPEQSNFIKGVEVRDKNGRKRMILHGDYENFVGAKLDTVTEEQVFSIIIYDMPNLIEIIQTISKKIKDENEIELNWLVNENLYLHVNQESNRLITLRNYKDSHLHINSNLWLESCKKFVCYLQEQTKQKVVNAYVTKANLYRFTKG